MAAASAPPTFDVLQSILSEDVFASVLVRERKRADRFNQPLFLLRVALDERSAAAPTSWLRAAEALSAVKRHSDVLGWCRSEAMLGLVVPEIHGADAALARELPGRFRRELETRLRPNERVRLTLSLQAHPCPPSIHGGEADDVHAIEVERRDPPRIGGVFYPAVKRACDIAGSALLLLFTAPLLLLIAALVKLTSRGPVLFRQVRVGHMEKPFTLLKFRTMYVDADHALHQRFVSAYIKASDEAAATHDVTPFKMRNDPRVTRIGALLRKTSLDELPQFWNVLRGEMSLVGPRPPIDYEVEQYEPWHRRRVTDVKPGLTGLWQVAGRSRTTFDQMVRLDLRYAKTCSLWSDLKILVATPAAMISGKGAR